MKHVLDINLSARLAAYTKNALLEQAPQDSKVYGRKNTEWVDIGNPMSGFEFTKNGDNYSGYNIHYSDNTNRDVAWAGGNQIASLASVEALTLPIETKANNSIKEVKVTTITDTHPVGGESYDFVNGVSTTKTNGLTLVQHLNKLVPKSYVDDQFVASTKRSGILYGTAPNSYETYTFPYDTPNSTELLNGRFIYRTTGGNVLVPLVPTNEQHATSKKYVDDLADTRLPIAGGTMQGNIDMDNYSIIVKDPINEDDVANKRYVNEKVAEFVSTGINNYNIVSVKINNTEQTDVQANITGNTIVIIYKKTQAYNNTPVIISFNNQYAPQTITNGKLVDAYQFAYNNSSTKQWFATTAVNSTLSNGITLTGTPSTYVPANSYVGIVIHYIPAVII